MWYFRHAPKGFLADARLVLAQFSLRIYVRTNVQMARILPKVTNYASIIDFLDKILAYLIFL